MTARTGIASVTARIAIPERSLGEARTQRSGDGRLGPGPASRKAAASILHDERVGTPVFCSVADGHDGPIAQGRHCVKCVEGSARVWAGDDLQLVPSQCSIRVAVPLVVEKFPAPTAQISLAEIAATPVRQVSLVGTGFGFGLETMLQLVPSQCSIAGLWCCL